MKKALLIISGIILIIMEALIYWFDRIISGFIPWMEVKSFMEFRIKKTKPGMVQKENELYTAQDCIAIAKYRNETRFDNLKFAAIRICVTFILVVFFNLIF